MTEVHMHTDKLKLSVGEISNKAIIERAEKRVPTTVNQPHHLNLRIEKEIIREKEEVFKKDFMGSPWDFLGFEDAGPVFGYIIFLLLIVSTYEGITQFFILLGLGAVSLLVISIISKDRIESAFKSGAESDWHRYEPEYSKALEEIRLRIETTRRKF